MDMTYTNEITTTYEVGNVVTYSDMANNSTYIVIAVDPANPWSTYTLRNVEDFSIETSDCGQNGWSLVAA